MALNLMVRVGHSVYIGDHPLLVKSAPHMKGHATLQREDGSTVQVFNDRMTEVYPNVKVGVGAKDLYGHACLLFEAPITIVILRQERYNKNLQGDQSCRLTA